LASTSITIPLGEFGEKFCRRYDNKKFLCIFLICFPSIVMAGGPSAIATKEISHLFECLNFSTCEFNRNGSWYKADKAAAHLNRKYEYLLRRNLVSSAEDFIERAATESSMSGQPYLVRCGNGSPVTSNSWFKEELSKYRRP
jgi:hypothetical protein